MAGLNSGDRLARGMSRAQFPPANDSGKVTDEKWARMFEGYDPEKFKKEGFTPEEGATTGEKETTTVGPAH